MNNREWSAIATRISSLWPPPMTPANIAAYYDVLRDLEATEVRRAVDLISRTDRERRPSAGLIFSTCNAEPEVRAALPPPPDADVLTPAEHHTTWLHLRSLLSEEHKRRLATVMDLARRGQQLPHGLLTRLMSEKSCTPAEFDAEIRRLEERP